MLGRCLEVVLLLHLLMVWLEVMMQLQGLLLLLKVRLLLRLLLYLLYLHVLRHVLRECAAEIDDLVAREERVVRIVVDLHEHRGGLDGRQFNYKTAARRRVDSDACDWM